MENAMLIARPIAPVRSMLAPLNGAWSKDDPKPITEAPPRSSFGSPLANGTTNVFALAGPVGPVRLGPVAPVDPVGPVAPKPVDPVGPVGPVAPVGPVDPLWPRCPRLPRAPCLPR